MAKTNFQSIDEYIAAYSPESRAYLREIRILIHSLAPDAETYDNKGRTAVHRLNLKETT